MPENASRAAALYDQFEDEHQVADWGGDELFTRMPRPRAVDDAPPPRFRPRLAAAEPAPPAAGAPAPATKRSLALVAPPADGRIDGAGVDAGPRDVRTARQRSDTGERHAGPRAGERAMLERGERLGLAVVEPRHRWDESGAMIEPEPAGRKTKVITGHPGGAPRPLPMARSGRRRPPRTPAEWIGPQPERIVAWAFALGLILILVAIFTA